MQLVLYKATGQLQFGGKMKNEMLNEIQNDTEIEFVELDDVSIAGADPTQITAQEEGRVLGFGCIDTE
ncbi:Uncharacterised protein [Legionella beliardensis]|uniref:Uncharacterized protein n=1 Tax=Legionella beliardensis TaxID=91822 RepID=A0A378HZD1_9GAMM|nr:hypothetical protein [Legionella beliardensis]STX28289.1 Uncharacterised protein [Legionella beliardensis]